tara:strand:+ start:144 stop:278 length:135 start_codon:yes stop_codon:yes gene_type:complete
MTFSQIQLTADDHRMKFILEPLKKENLNNTQMWAVFKYYDEIDA